MKTLFLIGNGFDLNCGMNTNYTDVYKGYIKEEAHTDCLRKFKKVISANIATWGDFEMSMAEYASDLYVENDFLECVGNFTEYMEAYLFEEAKRFRERMSKDLVTNAVVDEMGQSIDCFYEGISHNVDRLMERRNAAGVSNVEVVSFNYTDTIDYILAKCTAKWRWPAIDVLHIHGVLGDGPVLGVDNVEQIKANFVVSNKGKRRFVKPVFNELYDVERVERARELIYGTNTICVYGMSLGESDLTWRNILIDWLRQSEYNHLFVYNYDLSERNYRTVPERMDAEEDEKYRLFQKWGIANESQFFEQVHVPCGKNIFNVEKAIKKVNEAVMNRRVIMLEGKINQDEGADKQVQETAVTKET